MISGTFEEPAGATPLSPDDAAALIPSHITTRDELNAWEQANILEAARWVSSARTPALSTSAIKGLHKRMFNKTWEWAGRYRRSDTNIGVHWPTIPIEVENFVRDGRYWIDHHVFQLDEAAARLHHRLVKIHLFPNGNGRHARLWCDLLLRQNGRDPFEWGRRMDSDGNERREYIRALQAADGEHFDPLLELLLRDRG